MSVVDVLPRFFRSELIVPAFAVAILANMAAYLISPHAVDVLGAREMAAVLPLGAVLAGRTLGDHLVGPGRLRRWLLRPALALVAHVAFFPNRSRRVGLPNRSSP